MRTSFRYILRKTLKFLRLWPLSLAEKCRLAFGAAVIFTLAIALLIPYVWMNKLTTKASLDAGRARSQTLLRNHFRLKYNSQAPLPELGNAGAEIDPNNVEIRWIRFVKEAEEQLDQLTDTQKRMIESLETNSGRDDDIVWTKEDRIQTSNYVRIFKANDNCISCHNPQGSAKAFGLNESIGAAVIQNPAGQISKIILMNRVWIVLAGLIGGAGAIVAFYMITQRVILRPIRQLRGLVNNVAEGNLDIRSSIRTGDEYERLADAFNHMLDGLQSGQEKLREANKQLDVKIAELSERNIELFKANKVKSEFLANISHEFRTPLNAILGFAEILREKPALLKKEKGRKYTENIIAGGQRLLHMINDLLDMAKTEAGKMKLRIEKATVQQLCEALIASFSLITKEKKIKVKLAIDKNIPILATDVSKVQQILYNFLSNAVKFTPQRGKIEIRATMRDEKLLRLAVSDTGCGIAEADKEKIFEKFRQADGSITRESTGSGLGLAICRELAAMLVGTIGLESKVNKGSTFWLDIPITITPEQDKEQTEQG